MKYAVWQNTRGITNSGAKEIYQKIKDGAKTELPKSNFIIELARTSGLNILKETDCFIIIETDMSPRDDDETFHEIMFFALDHDLLLYDIDNNEVICCGGKYGTDEFVLYHASTKIVNSPSADCFEKELTLTQKEESFAILEGPSGFVQTSFDDGFTVEWNQGTVDSMNTLEQGITDLKTATVIFKAFLNNDNKILNSYKWCKVEFEDNESFA